MIGLLAYLLRDTVCAEYYSCTVGYLIEFFNEDCALTGKVIDHETIVHNFMAHIDRGAENLQRTLHNIDGAVNTGTKTTWIGKLDFYCHWLVIVAWALLISSISTVNTSA